MLEFGIKKHGVIKMENLLREEFDYYLANQVELVKKYNGRFIVIQNHKVIGDYDNALTAVSEAQKLGLNVGTFLVQLVSPGDAAYKQTFHSRVAFN